MSKFHEVLAAEASVKEKGKIVLEEAKSTFKNKQGHFEGLEKNFQKASEDDYDLPSESKHVQTTVMDKLNYVKNDHSYFFGRP
jgi:hypothetical protein